MTRDLPDMRASDADREAIAERLRDGFAEGRLDTEEFEQRLDAVYTSRTLSELRPLVRDLPQPGEGKRELSVRGTDAAPSKRWEGRFGAKPTSRFGVAVMGGFTRKGRWTMPRVFNCLALMGGGDVDLREAKFEEREVHLRAVAVMGGVDIVVPHDAEVVINGVGIMGGFDDSAMGEGVSEGPRIVISGLAFCGGVDVTRKPPRETKERGEGESPKKLM